MLHQPNNIGGFPKRVFIFPKNFFTYIFIPVAPTHVSCIADKSFTIWATREAHNIGEFPKVIYIPYKFILYIFCPLWKYDHSGNW